MGSILLNLNLNKKILIMPLSGLLSPEVEVMIYETFLPFIITFTIFWGILETLRIFNRKVNLILAVSLSVMAGYGGLFEIVSGYLMQLGAFIGLVAFLVIFVVGMIIFSYGRTRDIYYETGGLDRKIENIRKKMMKIQEKIDRAREDEKIHLYRELKKLKEDLEILEMERSRKHLK